jgi:hypothetical protein
VTTEPSGGAAINFQLVNTTPVHVIHREYVLHLCVSATCLQSIV